MEEFIATFAACALMGGFSALLFALFWLADKMSSGPEDLPE